MLKNKDIEKKKVLIKDLFWANTRRLIGEVVVPYQYRVLNDEIPNIPLSHAIENFKIVAGESQGEYAGELFQDSDVAKWIEAASYVLRYAPNHELEDKLINLVELIEKAQQDDGYLNTYYTIKGRDRRWTNFSHGHELYCLGHLINTSII